ncbi:MAG: type II toxin-antitoxin system RelE/ParE family toxin [Flavipsychrobacter sp.]|nr:type II toxin-antitoxin system RelE/ParE family toxin [Flavipsychrobacter sp.]
MAYEIVWLPKAEQRFDEIISWLQAHWSDSEIIDFLYRVEEVLELIAENPELYRRSEKADIHEAIVTKHNLLLYRKKGKTVELLTFFDTRQHPAKKFK